MNAVRRQNLWKAGLGAGVAAVLVGGVAYAAHRHAPPKPTTTPQSITFSVAAPKALKEKTCTGTDGKYALTNATYAGTASGSTDARLNNPVTMKVRTLLNTTTGYGSTVGTIVWRSAKTHAVTALGSVAAVDTAAGTALVEPNTLKGFILAAVKGIPAQKSKGKVVSPAVPPATLYANFAATGSPTTGWAGNTGSQASPANDARIPAVLQSGNC